MHKKTHTKAEIIRVLIEKLATSSSTIIVYADDARDALAYLKEPTMPAEPSYELLSTVRDDGIIKGFNVDRARRRYDALRAALIIEEPCT